MNIEKMKEKVRQTQDLVLGYTDIAVKISNRESLCNQYTYSSVESHLLNPDIEAYLLDSVTPFALRTPLKLIFYFTEQSDCEDLIDSDVCEKMVQRHFWNKIQTILFVRHREFRRWRKNLLIGVLFLGVCLSVSQLLAQIKATGFFDVLSQSFSIIGWVALWEPATFILYGWRDVTQEVIYCLRLILCPIECRKVDSTVAKREG